MIVLSISAQAAGTQEQFARALCERVERESPLPAALSHRILLGQTEEPSAILFSDPGVVDTAQAEALTAFNNSLAPCRDAMLSILSVTSTRSAEQRRFLLSRNERILSELIAQHISFGEANRQWDAAQEEFQTATAPAPVLRNTGMSYGSGVAWGGAP